MNHHLSSERPEVRRPTRRALLSLPLTFVILVSLVAGAALAAPSLSPDGVQIENPPLQQDGAGRALFVVPVDEPARLAEAKAAGLAVVQPLLVHPRGLPVGRRSARDGQPHAHPTAPPG